MNNQERAFVLVSGGIDSSTCLALAIARHGRDHVTPVSIDYGQRHRKELEYAAKQARTHWGAYFEHTILTIEDMPKTALTDDSKEIPRVSYSTIQGVSPSYVPFRNGQMLAKVAALASAWAAEGAEGSDYQTSRRAFIYIGTHAEDAANDAYPDCRLDFIGAMGAAIYIGTYHTVRIRAPLIEMEKADIIKLGEKLGVQWIDTWSCYLGGAVHCGTCPTCRARIDGFDKAKVIDPTEYKDRDLVDFQQTGG
jgi:7-cyano-7-deazaguanine synthase